MPLLFSKVQGPVSISEGTSFCGILWGLGAAGFGIVRSLWDLTGTSAAVLLMSLSCFGAIRQFRVHVSWLRDFAGSCGGASFRMLRRGPGWRSGSIWWTSNHYEKRISGRYVCGRFMFMWLRRGTSMACRTVRNVCAIAYLCGLITWDLGWLISLIWVFFWFIYNEQESHKSLLSVPWHRWNE